MNTKKWILFLLTLCIAAALSVSVSAAEISTDAVSGEWTYSLSYGEATITGYSGSSTSVTVPSTLDGYTVVGIGSYVFDDCYRIKSVTFPKTLQTIGSGAFRNCRGLTEITLPESLTSLGYDAFYDCYNLKKITVHSKNLSCNSSGDTFSNSGKNAANGIEVIFSNSVTVIPAYIFDCDNDSYARITSVKIGKNVKSIGQHAFYNCADLKTVDIGRYMKLDTIEQYAFRNCTSLTNMTIPSWVTNIGYCAFENCSSMFRLDVLNPTCKFYSNKNTLGVPGKTVIYGYKGTSAETYANKYGYVFQAISIPFSDVSVSDYYLNPTMWAVDNGITNGTSSTTFSPLNACERCQVVTFLWRAVGCPELEFVFYPLFIDIKSSDYFYKPVVWAVKQNITTGTDSMHFSPYTICNRAAVVTFLWRAAGCPEPVATSTPFIDVKSTDFFYKPVLWAVEEGITNGIDATHFGPDAACNRAQVVTFLYRAYN